MVPLCELRLASDLGAVEKHHPMAAREEYLEICIVIERQQ